MYPLRDVAGIPGGDCEYVKCEFMVAQYVDVVCRPRSPLHGFRQRQCVVPGALWGRTHSKWIPQLN